MRNTGNLFIFCLSRRLLRLWGAIILFCILSGVYLRHAQSDPGLPDSIILPPGAEPGPGGAVKKSFRGIGTSSSSPPGDVVGRKNASSFDSVRWRNGLRTAGKTGREGVLVSSPTAVKSLGERGFLVGLNYWEQFTMATSNLFKLLCLAADWNLRVVMPFTYKSRLYGLPSFKPDNYIDVTQLAIDLSTVYDKNSLNDIAVRGGLPAMASFSRDFLTNAARRLTVIHFIAPKVAHEVDVGKMADISFDEDSVVDCKSRLKKFSNRMLASLSAETNVIGAPPFYIDKHYCVTMTHVFTPRELAERVGISSLENPSIIVVNWRGMSDKPFFVGAKGMHTNNRILMSNVSHTSPFAMDTFVEHSHLVRTTTELFMQHLGLVPRGFIAVHIRSEKLGLREPRLTGSIEGCLSKTVKVCQEISTQSLNSTVVYVLDFGPYRSDSCLNCKAGKTASEFLSKQGIIPVQFDPSLSGAPKDSAFVAAVEMNLLAVARELVVCGGGAFQQQVKERFLRNNLERGEKAIREVCVNDQSTIEVLKLN